MRITIVYRYFWPDVAPYGLLLEEMIPRLVREGHEINVFTAQPAYRVAEGEAVFPSHESKFGANIYRTNLFRERGSSIIKAVNMLLFTFKAVLRILFGQKQDIYWVGTTPPVIQSFFVVLAARIRGAKTIYQMQDIHPEIAIAGGVMSSSVVTKLLRWLDNFTLKNASVVTVLSRDMEKVISQHSKSKANIKVINNFALGVSNISRKKKSRKPIKFVYAGNIGKFQNLKALVSAFSRLEPEDAVLEMVGDGVLRKELESFSLKRGIENINFHGQKTSSETFEYLTKCDVGLISLSPELYQYAYPTKIHTYLAANLRLIAMIETESTLADIVRSNGLGETISWQASEDEIILAMEKLILAAINSKEGLVVPKRLWHSEFALMEWLSLLGELEKERA